MPEPTFGANAQVNLQSGMEIIGKLATILEVDLAEFFRNVAFIGGHVLSSAMQSAA